ncbi:MAG: serine/threonine-protein kinase, partial [Chloroflexota bacterium]|nr:serine/threonine-protein kinase [Chloroflexota bacterium]
MSLPPQNASGVQPEPDSYPDLSAETDGNLFDDLTQRMIGPYQLEARLGGGAMASVYRAVDPLQGRVVALKVVLPGADSTMRERFRLEARMASTLAHPNIVPTLRIGQTTLAGMTYIAMELVEGTNLADVLEQKRQLPVADSCKLLEPIAHALAYAHGQAVIHRDVKPSNILLRRVDASPASTGSHPVQVTALDFPVVPLLSDFGIARSLDAPELTTAGRTIGTPAYMAPEQCAGSRQIDGRADLYALGAVLYRCLVGRPPFVGTTTQILHAHVYEQVTIPEEIGRNLPPVVIEILRKTLAKEPDQRYAHAALLADDLAVAARIPERSVLTYDESTTTMMALPSVSPPSTAQVLVPAFVPRGNLGQAVVGEATAVRPLPEREPVPATAAARPVRRPPVRTNWVGVLFGMLLALLPLLVGVVVIAMLLPLNSWSSQIFGWMHLPQLPATPIAISTAPATPALDAATAPTVTVNGLPPGIAITVPPGTITSTALLPPAIDVPNTWEDVQAAYADRDWLTTRNQLIPILRQYGAFNQALSTRRAAPGDLIADFFFTNPSTLFWQQWQILPQFTDDRVRTMLFQTYVGLATEFNAGITHTPEINPAVTMLAAIGLAVPTATGDVDKRPRESSVDDFNNALALDPTALAVAHLRDATVAYVQTDSVADKATASVALVLAHRTYAEELADAADYCGAREQLAAAAYLAQENRLTAVADAYAVQCSTAPLALARLASSKAMTGTILYSTQTTSGYRIYRLRLTANPEAEVLIQNGRQPSLSPDGKVLAFYGTSPGTEGVNGVGVDSALSPTAPDFGYATQYVEDGAESPPTWSPLGDQIAFGSRREGDRRPLIFIQSTTPGNSAFIFLEGEQPAWRATRSGNSLVYKGTDGRGNQSGLWTANTQGDNQLPINESESTDARPTWTPDGESVVFMSAGRHGNWEIYRLTLTDG